jgi:hypothetical protein
MIDVLIQREDMVRARIRTRLRSQGKGRVDEDDVYQTLAEYALRYESGYSEGLLDRMIVRATMELFSPDEWIDLQDIRSYRERLGLTQQQFADAIVERARFEAARNGADPFEIEVGYHCTREYISQIEAGERHVNKTVLTALQALWRDFVREHQPVLTGDEDYDQGSE